MPRGRKPDSPDTKRAKGKTKPSEQSGVVSLFPELESVPDPDHIPPPSWLPIDAQAIWDEKVARYRKRGQKVDGFQDALAQFCVLEMNMRQMGGSGMPLQAAMVTQYRLMCAEFYDTPASQRVPVSATEKPKGNSLRRGSRA